MLRVPHIHNFLKSFFFVAVLLPRIRGGRDIEANRFVTCFPNVAAVYQVAPGLPEVILPKGRTKNTGAAEE